jgi:localization factor PodJL
MKFGVPWSVKGIRPEVRESAREAARRSGVSLGEWLNAVILQQAEEQGVRMRAGGGDDDLAGVHRRLDELTRRIEQMTRNGPAAYAPRRAAADAAAPPVAPPAPPMPAIQLPPSLDRALAEIAARKRALDDEPAAPAAAAARAATARAPLPMQDLSGLEEQLRRITDQIEALRHPGVEEAINALRQELRDIGRALADAMPRRSLEAIEAQIAGLAQRVAEGRQAGVDHEALAAVERGLAEVRDALRSLTPAENLVGFNEAIAGLAEKIDLIVAQKDPATFQQLENAVNTLRSLASHVASNETVGRLAAEVQTLSERVERIAEAAGGAAALDHLEQRINALAEAQAERARTGLSMPPHIEALVQSLSERIEQIQAARGDNVALGHLEDRIVRLVEKLDASESRLGQLEAIERGLSDLLVHIESGKQGGLRAESAPAVDDIKHEIARTQDALDGVNNTLALVIDRLAAIEKDVRNARGEAQSGAATGKVARHAIAAEPEHPAPQAAAQLSPPPAPSLQPPPGPKRGAAPPIAPDLPPDQPLEPGSGPPPRATPSARIAASEAALGGIAGAGAVEPGGKSNFIAAARRAAQAALQQAPTTGKPSGVPNVATTRNEPSDDDASSLRTRLSKRIKSLFIAASIVAIVIGGAQIGTALLHQREAAKNAKVGEAAGKTSAKATLPPLDLAPAGQSALEPVAPPLAAPAAPAAPDPLATTPDDKVDRPANDQSFLFAPPDVALPAAKEEVTGSIPSSNAVVPPRLGPDDLPAGIGSKLRDAALSGDAAAAYEIALRFAEGRGAPVNLAEAARWFERAAGKGLALAQFRYASMLEKGQGVKKDLNRARELYLAAAAKGNAKAMHNLAVLYAEGIDGKPDYDAAVTWFRRAAQRGISDSQYNLGVLAARGLGTNKDFAESYKWFALAAARGDMESARKRDEVAAHLDAAALAAAQQAVKAFVPLPQPVEATSVPKPQGGWDNAAAGATDKPVPTKPKPRTQPAPHAPLSLGSFTVGNR